VGGCMCVHVCVGVCVCVRARACVCARARACLGAVCMRVGLRAVCM
jgi:hypothetical protein